MNEIIGKGSTSKIIKINNKTVIKELRSDSTRNNLNKEYKILKLLEKWEIAPKVLKLENNKLYREYISGTTLKEFLEREKDINKILFIFQKLIICVAILDLLKINHNQLQIGKNIIITFDNKIKIIDFEKATINAATPKNVGQICGYYLKNYLSKENFEKIKELVKKWKKLVKEIYSFQRN